MILFRPPICIAVENWMKGNGLKNLYLKPNIILIVLKLKLGWDPTLCSAVVSVD